MKKQSTYLTVLLALSLLLNVALVVYSYDLRNEVSRERAVRSQACRTVTALADERDRSIQSGNGIATNSNRGSVDEHVAGCYER